MKIEGLCLGDIELLRDIADGKEVSHSRLNDSHRRSARFLYNNELIDLYAEKDGLSITTIGRELLEGANP